MASGLEFLSKLTKPYARKDGKVGLERASNLQQKSNGSSSNSNSNNANNDSANTDGEPFEFD